jgi:hypothetical protein
MKIIAHDHAGAMLTTEVLDYNIWIEVKREDGVLVDVDSLFFDERADGSLSVQWGTARHQFDWKETHEVIVPAAELATPTPNEGASE